MSSVCLFVVCLFACLFGVSGLFLHVCQNKVQGKEQACSDENISMKYEFIPIHKCIKTFCFLPKFTVHDI